MVGNAPIRIGYAALELGGARERREEKHEARGGVPIKRNPKKNVYRKTSRASSQGGDSGGEPRWQAVNCTPCTSGEKLQGGGSFGCRVKCVEEEISKIFE